jgi:hypothetical protein
LSKRCLKIVKISSAIGGDFGNKSPFCPNLCDATIWRRDATNLIE